MEILEAFDATGSYRAAGQLAGCSHHTVAAYVAARDAGRPVGAAARRPRVIDEFLPKVEELVEKTQGKVRPTRSTRCSSRSGSKAWRGRRGARSRR